MDLSESRPVLFIHYTASPKEWVTSKWTSCRQFMWLQMFFARLKCPPSYEFPAARTHLHIKPLRSSEPAQISSLCPASFVTVMRLLDGTGPSGLTPTGPLPPSYFPLFPGPQHFVMNVLKYTAKSRKMYSEHLSLPPGFYHQHLLCFPLSIYVSLHPSVYPRFLFWMHFRIKCCHRYTSPK